MDEIQFKKLFGKRLKELRMRQGLTQEKLSELLWIDPQHYCKMENGNHFPSLKNLLKLAEVLNVNVQDLVIYDNSEKDELIRQLVFKIENSLTESELEFLNRTISALIKLRNK